MRRIQKTKKMQLRLLVLIMLAAFLTVGGRFVRAEEAAGGDELSKQGLLPMEISQVNPNEAGIGEAAATDAGGIHTLDRKVMSASYGTGAYKDWAAYSSYFLYNQMTEAEQSFYDGLMELCLGYFGNNVTVSPISSGSYYIEGVTASDLGSPADSTSKYSRAVEIFYLFRNNNPQFFFLMNGVAYSESGSNVTVYPRIYPAFATQEARTTAAEQISSKVESIINNADGYTSQEDQVKSIHDQIACLVKYNYASANNIQAETESFSQSVYSTFTPYGSTDNSYYTTVCAGYAGGFAMVCNKMGIDAVVMTSQTHAWNRVKIDDVWYTIDCTWDDMDEKIDSLSSGEAHVKYMYYLRSDSMLKTLDKSTAHQEAVELDSYLGACGCIVDCEPAVKIMTTDSGTQYPIPGGTAGRIGVIPETAGKVTISAGAQDSTHCQVTLSSDDCDIIYYTVSDSGTDPQPGQSICRMYTAPFTAAGGKTIRALAVKEGKKNSSISELKVSIETYSISYDLAGGISGGDNPDQYSNLTETFTLANPTRPGYTFAGWTGTGLTKASTNVTIPKGSTGNRTYTAVWSPVPYTITINLNLPASGFSSVSYPTSYTIESETFTLEAPTCTGYVFTGWTGSNGTIPEKSVSVQKGTMGNLSYTASWQAETEAQAPQPDAEDPQSETEAEQIVPQAAQSETAVQQPQTSAAADPAALPASSAADPAPPAAASAGAAVVNTGSVICQVSGGEAVITAPADKTAKKIVIPGTVVVNGQTVPVTGIAPNAFAGMKNLTTVVIGSSIEFIGKNAFRNCKNLKKITIRSVKLTKKSVAATAFKGIFAKAVVKCPKSKRKAYAALLVKKGMKKTVKFR